MINIISGQANWAEALGAILSFIGTCLLIWTLTEQRKVTKIEQTNFRLALLPLFKVQGPSGIDKNDRRDFSFSLFIKENSIQKLTITHYPEKSIVTQHVNYDEHLVVNINDEIVFTGYYLNKDREELGYDKLEGKFTLNFIDDYHNSYIQHFIVKPNAILPQNPKFIKQLESI